MDSVTGWAVYTIMFIVTEVILLTAIICLFAKEPVQISINDNGDKDENK